MHTWNAVILLNCLLNLLSSAFGTYFVSAKWIVYLHLMCSNLSPFSDRHSTIQEREPNINTHDNESPRMFGLHTHIKNLRQTWQCSNICAVPKAEEPNGIMLCTCHKYIFISFLQLYISSTNNSSGVLSVYCSILNSWARSIWYAFGVWVKSQHNVCKNVLLLLQPCARKQIQWVSLVRY